MEGECIRRRHELGNKVEASDDVLIAELAVAWNQLPSKIREENLVDILNVLAILNAQGKKQEKEIKKIKRNSSRRG